MFESLTDLQITGIIHGNSTAQAIVENRPSHTIIYKIDGESIYYLRNTPVHLVKGTALYIPEGESYSFLKISENESPYYLVNFRCSRTLTQYPHLFFPALPHQTEEIFRQMESAWPLAHNDSYRFILLSHFYRLVSNLLKDSPQKYYPAQQKQKLAPALQYLENHLYDHTLSIAQLADLCGISCVTFRNLFFAEFKESPKQYIIRCRLMKAKAIIESGEYSSIHEVSNAVGYEDPLYFSRYFKHFFGCAPSKANPIPPLSSQ